MGMNNSKKESTDIQHIEEIIKKAVQLSQETKTPENEQIILAIKSEILTLAKDVTGNYSIQKILNNKDKNQMNFIIDSLKNKIYELTLHLYGCRVVQELITALENNNLSIITNELKPFYKKCIEDKNGNHVIQKLIENLNERELNDIFLVSMNNIINLSKHQYGCRVIQKLFKYCNEIQINDMLNKIFKNLNELIQDQYGNYVMQFILENNKINRDLLIPIYDSLRGHIYEYSIHKFASNVVERALTFGKKELQQNIINEIVALEENCPECIITMVKDKFGNYVIQKIIEHADPISQQKIIKAILDKQSVIKNDGFSKHVLNYIEKLNNGGGNAVRGGKATGRFGKRDN